MEAGQSARPGRPGAGPFPQCPGRPDGEHGRCRGSRAGKGVGPGGKSHRGPGHQPGCSCGCKGASGAKELHRPQPWPELDAVENTFEADLKTRWLDLQARCIDILKLNVADIVLGQRAAGTKGPEDLPPRNTFTFSAEQRRAVMTAMNGFIGEYGPDDPQSPLFWYYGQAYSLGLIQAVHMIGQERPVLDLIKNREIYEELVKNGFGLVRDNATRAIVDRILPEMEAMAIAGANPLSVAARLKQLFGNQNSNWRRLARTEITIAAETAKLKEWAQWEVERVEFAPAPDACPICVALRGDYPIAECPVPGRDTHPHCRCSTRPAASEVGGSVPVETGGLAQRFEVNNIDSLGPLLQAFDRENPGLMVNGFRSITQVSDSYFMATIPPRGEFMVSNVVSSSSGFHPSRDLVAALQKIRRGEALSFHEEYSIESLWHEICHNRAKKYVPLPGYALSDKRVCMEALNQLVARQTYPEFMAKLGGSPAHFEKVLAEGYGYGPWVRNLRMVIKKVGLNEKAIVPEMEKILYKLNYDRVKLNLAATLAKLSGKEKGKITVVLTRISEPNQERFQAILDQVLG